MFTYTSFLTFLRDGLRAGLFPYRLAYTNPHAAGTFEFHVVLQKDSSVRTDPRHRVEEVRRVQEMMDALEGIPTAQGEYILR